MNQQIEILRFCHLAELHLLTFCYLPKGMFLVVLLLVEVELESHKNIVEHCLLRSTSEFGPWCLEEVGLSSRAPKLHPGGMLELASPSQRVINIQIINFGQMQHENYFLSLLRDSFFLPSTYLTSSQFLDLPGLGLGMWNTFLNTSLVGRIW